MTLRRDLLFRSALFASAGFFAAPARADTAWNPDRTLRIVVPVAPGGSLDILGRLLAKHLTEALGQNVVTENKPGAGSNIAFELVARAAVRHVVAGAPKIQAQVQTGQVVRQLRHRQHAQLAPRVAARRRRPRQLVQRMRHPLQTRVRRAAACCMRALAASRASAPR